MSKFIVTYINLDNMAAFQRTVDCGDAAELAVMNQREIESLNAKGGDWFVNGFMDEFNVNSYIGVNGEEYIS